MKEDEVGPPYCSVMNVLKARVQTVSEVAFAIRPSGSYQGERHNAFLGEGLYLQLRKISEILAIGVLVSQSTDERFREAKMQSEYRADKLLTAVSRINPKRFPRPIQGDDWTAGSIQLVWEHPPLFTAEEVKSLYYECDNRMHAGRLKDILQGNEVEYRQDLIREWVDKLITGLANHIIAMPQKGRSMIVQMGDSQDNFVTCRFASLAQ